MHIPIVLYFPLLPLSETSNTKYLIVQISPTKRKKQNYMKAGFFSLTWKQSFLEQPSFRQVISLVRISLVSD